MKTTTSIVLLGFLGVLAGCSTSSAPEPAPGPSEKPSLSVPGARTLGRDVTDVVPQKLFTRPALAVATQLVQHSTPLAPNDVLGHGYLPEETTHTDILHLVPKGVAGVYKVPVDTTEGEAYLFLSPQVEGTDAIQAALRDVVVLDPNGVRVNQRAVKGANQDPSMYREMSAIPLAGHPAGTYTVQFKSGAPQVGLAIEARLLASKIVMKLKPSTTQHLLGNTSFVDATLLEGSTPITGANVVADLVDGEDGHTVMPVVFNEIGNGVYRAALDSALTDASKIGAYLTDVRAQGTSPSGAAFFRHGRTGFHFGIPTAKITGIADQRAITDGNGLLSAFEVDVNVDSRSLDRLELSAKLTVVGADGQERPIAVAHTGAGFDAGMHKVTLHFDAGQVRLTKAEGTFYVRDMQMFSLGTNTLFHRELAADNRSFPSIARASLAPLKTLTPAQSQLVADGLFSND